VFDLISAKVADRLGFGALYATGYGMVASHLGLADVGLATYSDMVARAGQIAQSCRTPVIADADTGYGGLINVRHSVRGYEVAGIAAIQIEDQESPKKCGHTPGRRVIPAEEMALKIEVAVESRNSPDFLVIARTDARTSLGLGEAIRRGQRYARAGADIVFVESPESEDELARIGQEIDAPLLANMVEGGRTPILSAERLAALGFTVAIYPAIGFLAAAAALERVYEHLRHNGDSTALPASDSYGFERMCDLMGFPQVWEFERQWAARGPAADGAHDLPREPAPLSAKASL
jgi:2-methylisocitrate lyase-like PEP mutase family enzyme